MEFVNLMDTTAGAFWSPAFEADSFNSFVTESQGKREILLFAYQ